jgi:hypothetical protein
VAPHLASDGCRPDTERNPRRRPVLRPDDTTRGALHSARRASDRSETGRAAEEPNTGRLSISAGVDSTSAYFFRGIKQETEDLILQPYGELSVKLLENAGHSPR